VAHSKPPCLGVYRQQEIVYVEFRVEVVSSQQM